MYKRLWPIFVMLSIFCLSACKEGSTSSSVLTQFAAAQESLHVQSVVIRGITDEAAVVTVNMLADEDAAPLAWSVEQVVDLNDIEAAFESEVDAVDVDALLTTQLVTITITD